MAGGHAFADRRLPRCDQSVEPSPFDGQRVGGIKPKSWIKDALRSSKQLTRIQNVPFFGHALTQLLGSQ
jgi:hypothetical protein